MAIKVGNTTVIDDNRRILVRVNTQTTAGSSLTPNSDNVDEYVVTAQNAALTIAADTGTPVDGQKMLFRIKDDGTARTLAFTTGSTKSFRAIGITLPNTTVAGKTTYIACKYNSADSRWDVLAANTEA